MSKYNEIMDRIVVTEEMKTRILSNIDKSDLGSAHKISPAYPYRRLLSAAACFAVILISAIAIPKFLNTSTHQDSIAIAEITEVDTIEELSQSVGFAIEDLAGLPFESVQTIYTNYGNGLAEIAYTGKNQTLYYRKSPGTNDNSGDYTIYDSETKAVVHDMTVILKENNGLFMLATWTDGKYAYSISLTEGLPKDSLINIIKENN